MSFDSKTKNAMCDGLYPNDEPPRPARKRGDALLVLALWLAPWALVAIVVWRLVRVCS